jgi:hypothetical protein
MGMGIAPHARRTPAPGVVVVVAAVAVAAGLAAGCKDKGPAAVATLARAAAPVDRAVGAGAWQIAPVGTGYFLGDAARTGDGDAELAIAGGARLAMTPHTILRFGGGATPAGRLEVELGAIELTGTGAYQLELGEVKLADHAGVRVTARGKGASSVELLVGDAQITTVGGAPVALKQGEAFELGMDISIKKVVDAGVAAPLDAGIDAGAPDAAPVDAAGAATVAVAVTGGRAEIQRPGEKGWSKLAAGAAEVPAGAAVRIGPGSTAVFTHAGASLELGAGGRVTITGELFFSLETGGARAVTEPGHGLAVAVPGGGVDVDGGTGPADSRIEVGGRDTKLVVSRGAAKLTAGGETIALNRGESATVSRAGVLRTVEAIPTYFDVVVPAGDTVTIHDPKPPTAVQLQFGGRCSGGGIVEVDRDGRFRAARVSGGRDAANVSLGAGTWAYRLRCTQGAAEGAAVASGRIVVSRDDGRRALPRSVATNPIDADGRHWRISYQSLIPTVAIKYLGAGASFRLHLVGSGKDAGKDVTFDSATPMVTIPGTRLKEGEYTYWFEHDGVKQDKISTLKIDFDQTAPQVYIEAPSDGQPFTASVEVRGAVLPGWTASVDGAELPLDHQRRFMAQVASPKSNALAIRLAHPERGVHFYLRRAK